MKVKKYCNVYYSAIEGGDYRFFCGDIYYDKFNASKNILSNLDSDCFPYTVYNPIYVKTIVFEIEEEAK